MKLLINTSTLSATGVTQVAVSFINECKKLNENDYHVFLSKTVASQINTNDFPINFKFYEFTIHPIFTIQFFKTIKRIKEIEKNINPDCVFSVFGPSYWTPQIPHLQGYAYPYYVYPESPIFHKLTIKEKLKFIIYKISHKYLMRNNGKYFVSETKDVANRAVNYLACPQDKMFAVSNTCNSFYDHFIPSEKNILPIKAINEFRFLSLCSYAKHKNLDILNKVIPLINQLNPGSVNIKFVLTIDETLLQKHFSYEAQQSIINIGRIEIAKCPQLYFECDALFLPTLLECFSANYPEAMKMERPILTSELSFATSVCENAALYFDPLNSENITKTIFKLVYDQNISTELIKAGNRQISRFLTSEERAKKYIEICNHIKNLK